MNSIRKRFINAVRILRYGDVKELVKTDYPSLSSEEVEEARSFFPMQKFFIFGHARSGTTLAARLIKVHPEVHCNWQAHFFTRTPLLSSLISNPEVVDWLTRKNNRWNRGKDLSPVVMRAASDFILERDAQRLGKRVVGDKSPNNLLNGESVRLLHAIYPDAVLIFIVRDGRDTVISHRFQQFIDIPDHLGSEDEAIRNAIITDSQPFFIGKQSIFTQRSIINAAQGWVCNVVETDKQAKDLFPGQYINLRYEDLIKDPVNVLLKVWDALGVGSSLPELNEQILIEMNQNPDAEWQRQKEYDLAAKLHKGMTGSWREYFTDRDKMIFKEIAGNTLITLGYEVDHNW